ncbi:D-methionine transport system substrate-binding protein [Kushneria sinocarnis]|uniref:Lipoprotein n=1 Tax=Kushneria sinocarnis TaxID=595502 RepID=A0A420WXT1_9GAMM|nr:MetQ/NlpA family ABC transporter substrate-binding protein [Kushneria sinocarnis]RKR06024.1 D-methionine transport system substrate-binding protein [Kushneria sinocarnis]
MPFTLSRSLRLTGAALALTGAALLSACGGSEGDDQTVRVGTIAGPETELMQEAKRIAQEQYGLEVEITEFNDYVSPNVALANGNLDANAYQHQPYLDSMNSDRGWDLVAAGKTFLYPIGAYSKKYDAIDSIPDGTTIALPNDPSNEARSLLILARNNLIELKDASDPLATPDDITANPHNFRIVELDAAQLPRSLSDVGLAFINNTFAEPAGLKLDDALLRESPDSPYVNLIVVQQGDQDKPAIRHLVKAFQSPAVADKARELFGSGAIAGWQTDEASSEQAR